jgi:hypothetical protein
MISFIHMSIGLKSWCHSFCSSQNPKPKMIGVLSIATYPWYIGLCFISVTFLNWCEWFTCDEMCMSFDIMKIIEIHNNLMKHHYCVVVLSCIGGLPCLNWSKVAMWTQWHGRMMMWRYILSMSKIILPCLENMLKNIMFNMHKIFLVHILSYSWVHMLTFTSSQNNNLG